MSAKISPFVWYDVMTSDIAASQAFYEKVVGWKVTDAGMPDRTYKILHAGSTSVGGLMPLPDEAKGTPPCWTGYVGVADVDDYAGRVKKAGGTVHRAPEDIPGVGRFAVVADPAGAVFILFKGASDMAPSPPPPDTPGHIGWHELLAGDGDKAMAFYTSLFGWTKTRGMDMGPMGEYHLFATGGAEVGGMMTKPKEAPAPCWLYYMNVAAIDAAAARVTGTGGTILNGPMEVPGGHWIIQCKDPQGAVFALVATKR